MRYFWTNRGRIAVCACDYGRPFAEINQTASCYMPYRA